MGARLDNMRDPRQRQMQREGIRQRQEQIRQRQEQAEQRANTARAQAEMQGLRERARSGGADSPTNLFGGRFRGPSRGGPGYGRSGPRNDIPMAERDMQMRRQMRMQMQEREIQAKAREARERAMQERQMQARERAMQERQMQERSRGPFYRRVPSRGTFFGPGRADRGPGMSNYQQMINRFRGGFR